MCGRAAAVVDAVRVGHVGLVIGRVKVHTIPAGREKDLSPEAIWAPGVAESWSLRHRRTIEVDAGRSFRSVVIVKVRERDRPKPRDALGIRAPRVTSGIWVSSEHAKAVWKGFHGLSCSAALEIVATTLIRRNSFLSGALKTCTSIPPWATASKDPFLCS